MTEQFEPVPDFTTSEIHDAIGRFKRGKTGDNSGIRAEQIKKLRDETKEKYQADL